MSILWLHRIIKLLHCIFSTNMKNLKKNIKGTFYIIIIIIFLFIYFFFIPIVAMTEYTGHRQFLLSGGRRRTVTTAILIVCARLFRQLGVSPPNTFLFFVFLSFPSTIPRPSFSGDFLSFCDRSHRSQRLDWNMSDRKPTEYEKKINKWNMT